MGWTRSFVGLTGVFDSLLETDATVASKVEGLYGSQGTLESVHRLCSEFAPRDGAHYYGCVDSMIHRKRSWEESTVEHWNKLAQVQSGKALKLSALNKSIFDQVDSIMEDSLRWRKRCTVLRGGYQVGKKGRTDL